MAGKRILVVEDSPTIGEMVKDELGGAGYQVFWAKNGFEALRDLDDIRPELIITDIMMPKVDGLELCSAMQNRSETKTIPLILFSSRFDEDTVKRGRAIGAKFFIAKPFKMETLLAAVKKVFAG
jgi:DNA-binding response OmpR family regulator